jgi:hypothetical protein
VHWWQTSEYPEGFVETAERSKNAEDEEAKTFANPALRDGLNIHVQLPLGVTDLLPKPGPLVRRTRGYGIWLRNSRGNP